MKFLDTGNFLLTGLSEFAESSKKVFVCILSAAANIWHKN